MSTHTFKSAYVRRLPDPVFQHIQRYIFLMRVEDLPKDLPCDPNPRAPNVDRAVWRDIRKHLLNEEGVPNTFHLKNKGITVLASAVDKLEDDTYRVEIGKGEGIVDGGHTFTLIKQTVQKLSREDAQTAKEDEPEEPGDFRQFVKVEVLTGATRDLATEIAGGLNTSIQVQAYSLENLREGFEWIKEAISDRPYADQIAFHENAEGTMDVRDLLVILDLFNIEAFPNEGMEHPVRAYSSKSKVLDSYLAQRKQFEILCPILNDILRLYDTIGLEARDKHNETGGRGGKLAFVEQKARGEYEFPFIGQTGAYRLHRAALLPMLAAFRWMVRKNPSTGQAEWQGGFEQVLAVWNASGGALMRATQETSEENKRKVHTIGRSRNHWSNLHSIVAKYHLMMVTR